jgi:hypothetical protein
MSAASRADRAAEQAVRDADHNSAAAAEAINDHDRPKGTGGAAVKGETAALNDLERDAAGNLKVCLPLLVWMIALHCLAVAWRPEHMCTSILPR